MRSDSSGLTLLYPEHGSVPAACRDHNQCPVSVFENFTIAMDPWTYFKKLNIFHF